MLYSDLIRQETEYTYSANVQFDIENDKIYNVKYTGGCNGNLKAIASLVEGQEVEEVIKRLNGITCGFKKTSCGDQLAKALEEIKVK